jgi:hypothetical protein
MVGLPTLVMTLVAVGAELRSRHRRRPRRSFTAPRALTGAAAACAVGATVVHVRVAPEHFHEAVLYGAFFALAATLQLGWAALMLVRVQRWTVVAGATGNAAMISLWLVTRSAGVPLGPAAGKTESIGALDVVATGCELATVILAGLILLRSRRSAATSLARPRVPAEGTMATTRLVGAAMSSE